MTSEAELGQALEDRIGRLLVELREKSGVSQAALALELGHDQSHVSRLERSERRLTVVELLRWASALGIPFRDLAEELERVFAELAETQSIWEQERT